MSFLLMCLGWSHTIRQCWNPDSKRDLRSSGQSPVWEWSSVNPERLHTACPGEAELPGDRAVVSVGEIGRFWGAWGQPRPQDAHAHGQVDSLPFLVTSLRFLLWKRWGGKARGFHSCQPASPSPRPSVAHQKVLGGVRASDFLGHSRSLAPLSSLLCSVLRFGPTHVPKPPQPPTPAHSSF